MSWRRIQATVVRIMKQLRHDKRTIAMLLFIPSFIILILYFVMSELRGPFNQYSPLVLSLMAFTVLFIVASITTLRERRGGTMDKLMTLPITKLEILLGYGLAFAVFAVLQSVITTIVLIWLLDVTIVGSVLQIVTVSLMSGLVGMSFGLFLSEFAKSEFQAVQFMPAFVFPQMLTCGLLVPIDQMSRPLQIFSDFMPLTYGVKAIREVMISSAWSDSLVGSLMILVAFSVGMLVLGALTIKRQR